MKSILLSFSLSVAGGVLRRMKSRTRVALNTHIGRLRSVLGQFTTRCTPQTKAGNTHRTAIACDELRVQ